VGASGLLVVEGLIEAGAGGLVEAGVVAGRGAGVGRGRAGTFSSSNRNPVSVTGNTACKGT